MVFEKLKHQVTTIINTNTQTPEQCMENVCTLLRETVSYYDWVGFYFANHQTQMLHLKAFAGEVTNHTTLPFGKGICGQVAISNKNFVVPDVSAQDNYIACSISIKSEIVIPMFKDGKNIGQIDIDSKTPDPFTKKDEQFLEWVNKQIAAIV